MPTQPIDLQTERPIFNGIDLDIKEWNTNIQAQQLKCIYRA
jgi:hypothetical protein